MKILLIYASISGKNTSLDDGRIKGTTGYSWGYYPPLGISFLASTLYNAGFTDIELLDTWHFPISLSAFDSLLLKIRPDIVGISCLSFSFLHALELAVTIKKRFPDLPIIIGGRHVESFPEEVLQHSCFDIGVLGEGEYTFLKLVKILGKKGRLYWKNLEGIKNIVYRRNNEIIVNKKEELIENLDNLFFPDLFWYKKRVLDRSIDTLPFLTTRGCSYHCSFCSKNVIDIKHRENSPRYVVNNLKFCIEKFGIRKFFFHDENFTLNKKRTIEICRLVQKEKLGLEFICLTRVDLVDLEILKELKLAGCRWIIFGVESGDQNILDKMNKETTVSQIKEAFSLCKKVGIFTMADVLIGHPDETKQSLSNTTKLLKDIQPNIIRAIILTLYPDAPLYHEFVNKRQIKDVWREMTVTGKAFRPLNICRNFTRSQLENYRLRINLLQYINLSNVLHKVRYNILHYENMSWGVKMFQSVLMNR